jgi:hypothetical protein
MWLTCAFYRHDAKYQQDPGTLRPAPVARRAFADILWDVRGGSGARVTLRRDGEARTIRSSA